MQNNNTVSKLANISGSVFFTVLFILSYVFYQQRMMTFDSSFFAFGMIDLKSYNVVVGRWGQLLPQLLPWLAFKLGASLEVFLKTYSVSLTFCYFVFYLLINKVLKHEKAIWILLLSMCLCYRDVFYYATAELHLGIIVCVFLYALCDNFVKGFFLKNKFIHAFLILLTIVFASQCNPITLFLVVFILIYIAIRDKIYFSKSQILFLLFTLVWYYIYLKVLNKSDYDEGKYVGLSTFLQQLQNLHKLPSTLYLISFFKTHFWSFALLSIMLFISAINSKHKLLSAFTILYGAVYFLVIIITYYRGESPIMYQNYYTLFGVLVALPFCDYYTKNWSVKFRNSIIILLLFINVRGLYLSNEVFTMRLDYISRLEKNSKQIKGNKYLVAASNFPWEYAWVRWALPFESILHSSVNKTSKTFYLLDDINQVDSLLNKPNVFLGPDWAPLWFSSNNLYKPYFNLDNDAYRKINSAQIDSVNLKYSNKKNAAVFFNQAYYYANHYKFSVVPLSIQNFTKNKIASIPSLKTPLLIAYNLFDDEGNCIAPTYRRAEFETDVLTKIETGLIIENPKKAGTYTLEAFLIIENATSASNVATCNFVVK